MALNGGAGRKYADVHSRLPAVSESRRGEDGRSLISFDKFLPGNGMVEMGRTYYINPKTENALKDVLFPDAE
jgi:hypothetical protein